MKNTCHGVRYSVKYAAAIEPMMPPRPMKVQDKVYKCSLPNSGSLLDCYTINASTTTSVKAMFIAATMKRPVMTLSSCVKFNESVKSTTNCKEPLISMYDFRLDPNMAKLSASSPYTILKLQGRPSKDTRNYVYSGSRARYNLKRSLIASDWNTLKPCRK